MPKTGTKPSPKKHIRRRKPAPASEGTILDGYADALRRICDVATDALNTKAEDEAAREAVEAIIPEFQSRQEFDAWLETLETVEARVDPRLREKVKTSIRLSRRTIDGYNHLAEKMGLRSGQTLMKIVLGNYLAKHLPEDF